MAGPRDSDDEEPRDDTGSPTRLLMIAVLVLAVAATVVLVLSDSAKMLRLGVLAALWAALLGVFLASRYRKVVGEKEMEVADLQSVYEVELEREVAARREYELQVEAEARKRVEEANREDMAALRAELRILRESLERLTGGEVLVERFALQARSTRMRTLAGGEAQPRVVPADRSLVAGEQPTVDASTELMSRPKVQKPAPQPPRQSQAQSQPVTMVSAPVSQPVRREPPQPTKVARPVTRAPHPPADWPSTQQRPAPQRPAPQQVRRPVPLQQQARPTRPPEPQPRPPADPTEQMERPWPAQTEPPRRSGPVRQPPERRRPADPEPPQVRSAVRSQRGIEPVERPRHRSNERAIETTGGHRRIEDGRTTTGRRARVEEPRWQDEDIETTGAHTAGRSVTEILAAQNQDNSPRRHRRRAD